MKRDKKNPYFPYFLGPKTDKWYYKLFNEFKEINNAKTLILWGLISLAAAPLSYFIYAKCFNNIGVGLTVSFGVLIVIFVGRFYNMQPGSFFTILTIALTAGGLIAQSQSFNLQLHSLRMQGQTLKTQGRALALNLKQMQLDTRPQLIIDIEPKFWNDGNASYFGGNITFENYGSFPARHIKSQYILQNNTKKSDDFKEWYAGTYGAFPEITFVSGRSKSDSIPLAPSIPREADYACIGVLTKYEGLSSDKIFWHMIRKTYRIIKNSNGEIKDRVLIDVAQESDDDSNSPPPSLDSPTWTRFKLGNIPR